MTVAPQLGSPGHKCARALTPTPLLGARRSVFREGVSTEGTELIAIIRGAANLKYHQIRLLDLLLLVSYVAAQRPLLMGFVRFHPVIEELGIGEGAWGQRGHMSHSEGSILAPPKPIPPASLSPGLPKASRQTFPGTRPGAGPQRQATARTREKATVPTCEGLEAQSAKQARMSNVHAGRASQCRLTRRPEQPRAPRLRRVWPNSGVCARHSGGPRGHDRLCVGRPVNTFLHVGFVHWALRTEQELSGQLGPRARRGRTFWAKDRAARPTAWPAQKRAASSTSGGQVCRQAAGVAARTGWVLHVGSRVWVCGEQRAVGG